MIVSVGIDVCSVERFDAAERRHPGLTRKLLTAAEAELSLASRAARFAAKEALAKALGSPGGLSWQDAEVCRLDSGAPRFELVGTVARRAEELGIATVHLSISHDAGLATAFVVCEA